MEHKRVIALHDHRFCALILLFPFWPFLPFVSIPFLLQLGPILLRGRRYRASMITVALGSLIGAIESILALDITLRTIGSPAAILALLIGGIAFVATALAMVAAWYLASGLGWFRRSKG